MISVEYRIPSNGLGSDFTENERPINFAKTYTNRFRNITGGAERRPGMSSITPDPVPGNPNLTRIHELVDTQGNETLLTSDDNGNCWRLNADQTWAQVLSGKAASRLISGEADGKLIFVNGIDRNFYTTDASAFTPQLGLIIAGTLAGGSNTTTVIDGNITDWVNDTLATNTDIIYNVTRNGYGIVTALVTANLTTTPIGTAGNGAGKTSSDQTSGDAYQLIDYVSMNIFPNGPNTFTNVNMAAAGTTTTTIAVSAFDFSKTIASNDKPEIGDFVYNTTQGAISQISSVSANVNLSQPIVGQSSGDALTFFKAAMPIADWIHVHYGRCYMLDARNNTRIVITAPDDPQDVTTFQNTLNTTSFNFGGQQPTADVIQTMTTFQDYFVAAGTKNLYIYKGATPIQDTSATVLDWTATAFYPNGVVGRFCLGTNGSDLLHVTKEGVQAINIGNISNTTIQNNASTAVRNAILSLIAQTPPDDVQMTFYPRRSWTILKIGSVCYILNTNPSYNDAGQLDVLSAWHLYSGLWAQQNHYFVRQNGDLLACGAGGYVYQMDNGDTTDMGQVINTDLVTAWLRLEEPQRTIRIKQGTYIRPIFESTNGLMYTINAVAGLDNFSSDTATFTVEGTGAIGSFVIGTTPIGAGGYAQVPKLPLRWRGEQVQIEFITATSAAPDVLSSFTIFGDLGGYR